MPTRDRTLDELLAYLADYQGPRPQRDLLDDVLDAHARGLVTDGEYESVVLHVADLIEAKGKKAWPRFMRECAEPGENRDVGARADRQPPDDETPDGMRDRPDDELEGLSDGELVARPRALAERAGLPELFV